MSNSIAVVTGAGSGIGAAIAKELAKRGNLVVVTDLNLASAKKVADEIGNADALELDVTNPSDVNKIIDQIINKHKKIDIPRCF
jgi:NAD(P)-dependent dehydrogenase (short-subunit alcohol dehydrogenase family)